MTPFDDCYRLRGTGGDLIVLEEAAFISTDVWTEVVLPVMQLGSTGVVGISTPLDAGNFFSHVINCKDAQGNYVFETLRLSAACVQCTETLEDPSQCPHTKLERPQWQSDAQVEKVKALYGGNDKLMRQELMAIISTDDAGAFNKRFITHLFTRDRQHVPPEGFNVFIGIDPNAAGASKYSIVSAMVYNGTTHVSRVRVVCTPLAGRAACYRHPRPRVWPPTRSQCIRTARR